jgi:KDO2-lipid IV(A) lauroyltransferase
VSHPLGRGMVRAGNLYRRGLALGLHLVGPRIGYALYAFMARRLYRWLDPLRERCLAQCSAALGSDHDPRVIARLSEQAFVHRAWNMVDLLLAARRVSADNFRALGGEIPMPQRALLGAAQARKQPVILITAYHGPFDLLPVFLGYNGIRATTVYLPHSNASFDAFRRRVRTQSGCPALPVQAAVTQLPEILDGGGAVALLADHHAENKGIPVEFLGLPTAVSRAVGVLAVRHGAVVAVAGIRRTAKPFRFRIVVADYFVPQDWEKETDPVVAVTQRYVAALDRMVREAPEQYLWAHMRWGPRLPTDPAGANPDKPDQQ